MPDGKVLNVEIGAAVEAVAAVVASEIIASLVTESIVLMVGRSGGDWEISVDKGKGKLRLIKYTILNRAADAEPVCVCEE